jgi:hypothetical protein
LNISTEDGGRKEEFRTALGDSIQQKIVTFERKGYFMIFVGALLNLPWIVLVLVLKNDIEYVP